MNDRLVPAGERFRSLLAKQRTVEFVVVHDALTARLTEAAAFDGVVVGGGTSANFGWALPDVGLLTTPELLETVRRVAAAVDIPVIADLDDGGPTPMHVHRHTQLAEQAGAAAIMIDDSYDRHLWSAAHRGWDISQDRLHPAERTIRAIQVAANARRGSGLAIVGRTLACPTAGFDEALMRAEAYATAGADLVHLSRVPLDLFTRESVSRLSAPVLVMPVDSASHEQVQALGRSGVNAVGYFSGPMLAAYHAFEDALTRIKDPNRQPQVPYVEAIRPLLESVRLRSWSQLGTFPPASTNTESA